MLSTDLGSAGEPSLATAMEFAWDDLDPER